MPCVLGNFIEARFESNKVFVRTVTSFSSDRFSGYRVRVVSCILIECNGVATSSLFLRAYGGSDL